MPDATNNLNQTISDPSVIAASPTTPPTPPSTDPTTALEEKKEAARLAMEGAEWTAKRETGARTKTAKEELAKLGERLEEIHVEKEKLELDWIGLDDTRRKIRKILEPILIEEKQAETEEAALETEEERVGVPSEKQAVEKKRWAIQDRRQETEKRKWGEEDKMTAIEKTINENTASYRQLLDEEDKLQTRTEQLKAETGA